MRIFCKKQTDKAISQENKKSIPDRYDPTSLESYRLRCAVESYLQTPWATTTEHIKNIEAATKLLAARKFKDCFGERPFVTRDITASDLGLKSWKTPRQAANKETPWVTTYAREFQVIGLCRLTQLSLTPKASEIKIQVGCASAALLELSRLYAVLPALDAISNLEDTKHIPLENIRMEGYLASPIIIVPGLKLSIFITSNEDNEGDEIVLGGYIIEVEGYKLAP